MAMKIWKKEVPKTCPLCGANILTVFVHGRLAAGDELNWGVMCKICHMRYGIGLGPEKGFKYTFDEHMGVFTKSGGYSIKEKRHIFILSISERALQQINEYLIHRGREVTDRGEDLEEILYDIFPTNAQDRHKKRRPIKATRKGEIIKSEVR
jgi:hypothetical protein